MASTTVMSCPMALPGVRGSNKPLMAAGLVAASPRRVSVVARTEGQEINPNIRKTEAKVVDSVVVTELSKPLTAYCRLISWDYALDVYVDVGGQGHSLYAMEAT